MKNSLSLKQRLTDYRYLVFFSALMLSLLLFFFGNTLNTENDNTSLTLFFIHAGLAILCLIGYIQSGEPNKKTSAPLLSSQP